MTRMFLAALAFACASSPAFAGTASEPVTWGMIGFAVLIVALAIIVFVLSIIASGFNH